MAVKLFNRTRYEDTPIKDTLNYAGRLIGVKGTVPVIVTRGYYTSGKASRGWPYRNYLKGTPSSEWPKAGLFQMPHAGYVRLVLGRGMSGQEVTSARAFFRVVLHEMGHIKDFRSGDFDCRGPEPKTASGRRIKHAKRPCEIVAENYADEAMERANRQKIDDLVLALALELEAKRGK